MNFKAQKIYIVGAGKVGSSFVYEFFKKKYALKFVSERNLRKEKVLAKDLERKKVQCSLKIEVDFISQSDVIFIMTQDAYITSVIEEISKLKIDLKKKLFLHISGSLSSEVFKKLKIAKSNCASFHPIQTFSEVTNNAALVENIYFGIEGGKNACEYAKKVAKDFHSNYFTVNPKKKHLYHVASVVTSNYLIGLIYAASKIIKEIGADENQTYKIYEPIIKNTLENIERQGIVKSLTGPIDRNDVKIIEKHIKELKKIDPLLTALYLNFGMITAELAEMKRSISKKDKTKLESLMKKYLRA
ncbi:MAG: DUF2520 domain-containing protein [Ignavibacteria bacterium]|nr:DUF2520 domain-containing protein [Ignavibacteria bacterium]